MHEVRPRHTIEELRELLTGAFAASGVKDEATLETCLFNGMQLAALAREFDCDFTTSEDYSRVTFRRIVPRSSVGAA